MENKVVIIYICMVDEKSEHFRSSIICQVLQLVNDTIETCI